MIPELYCPEELTEDEKYTRKKIRIIKAINAHENPHLLD